MSFRLVKSIYMNDITTPNMVNASHDIGDYDQSDYKHVDLYNADTLYDAMRRAASGSDWKYGVQKYVWNWYENIGKMHEQRDNYELQPTKRFVLTERGKSRIIDGEDISDRVVKHALCDSVLNPIAYQKIIYDTGACVSSRGIDFTRSRLVAMLSKFYRKHGNNGYVLLLDYKRYYDNIRHDILFDQVREMIDDPDALDLIAKCLDRNKVDVSYMSDEEYAHCMETCFNSIEYEKIDKSLLTGEKYMYKHLNIGDQFSQTAGCIYPIPIDNYIKIVRGVKFYIRYQDDSLIIHSDKKYLENLLNDIEAQASKIGLFINRKKTRIVKLSSLWRFLQIQYSLTDTGRIVQKINPKQLTRQRRKMRKLAGKLSEKEYHDWFWSYFKAHKKYMSRLQKENLLALYRRQMEVYTNGKADSF